MIGNNQQHLFYHDLKFNIVHVFYDNNSRQLEGPETWAGDPRTSINATCGANKPQGVFCPPVEADSARTAAIMWGDNQQHLFYLAPSGAIWHVLWDQNRSMPPESWAPPRDAASASLEGRVCSEYHPPVANSKNTLGTKTWDYNSEDGVAHYGTLPDFLHAVSQMSTHSGWPSGKELVDAP